MGDNEDIHAKADTRAGYASRSLDEFLPELRVYLSRHARVLDVGCGPGSITLDVAGQVPEGSVVGIDAAAPSIEQASQAGWERNVRNAEFRVGDALHLEFSDASFDVVYSHAVLCWIPDPVKALVEQRRVTRKGGWVLCDFGEVGAHALYPPCPALEKFLEAIRGLSDPARPDVFFDAFQGRRGPEMFSRAGFAKWKLSMRSITGMLQYQDGRSLCLGSLASLLNDERGQKYRRRLVEIGLMDEASFAAARKEHEAWQKHAHAFYCFASLIAAGQV